MQAALLAMLLSFQPAPTAGAQSRAADSSSAIAEPPPTRESLLSRLDPATRKAVEVFDLAAYIDGLSAAHTAAAPADGQPAPTASDVAAALREMGDRLSEQGEAADAEESFRAALAIELHAHRGDHVDVAAALTGLGASLRGRGDLDGAEALVREALAIQRRLDSGDSLATARTINQLASVLRDRGQFTAAEERHREALAMLQRMFPGDHPDVAIVLGDLGVILQDRGDLAAAEPLDRAALAMRQRLYPGDHAEVARAMNNLAFVLHARGDLTAAESMHRDALAMKRRLRGGDHPDVAMSLHNLGVLLQDRGELDAAEPFCREVLEMRRRLHPEGHASVAFSLNTLAALLYARGQRAQALELANEALSMQRRLLPGDHPDIAVTLDYVATISRAAGAVEVAEERFAEALALRRRLLPGDNALLTRSMLHLALVNMDLGRSEQARQLLDEATAMSERLRVVIPGGAAERAAFAHSLDLAEQTALLATCLVELGRPGDALEAMERGRARAALDLLEAGGRDLVAEARASGDVERARRLEAASDASKEARAAVTDIEETLADRSARRQAVRSRSGLDSAAKETMLADLDREIGGLTERMGRARQSLTQASAEVFVELRGMFPVGRPLALDEILAVTRPGELILSCAWTRYTIVAAVAGDGIVTGHVVARRRMVPTVDPQTGNANWVRDDGVAALTKSAEIVRRFSESRPGAADAPARPEFDEAARTLQDTLLPEALRVRLASAKRVVVVPDGPLVGIPLDVLAMLDGSPLAGKELVYAPSATIFRDRVIAARTNIGSGRPCGSAVILGDPAFERIADGAALARATVAASTPTTTSGSGGTAVGAGDTSAATSDLDLVRLFGGSLAPLPGTRQEALAAARLLPGATLLLGADASAVRLRDAVVGAKRPPRFLHLATHGLVGSADRPGDGALALAAPGIAGSDDIGFLTFEELVGRWTGALDGTELVVLSACDTGRAVQRGDTLFGLPLAFFNAGAPTLIASLWKVDDAATALLMHRLYENLLGAFDARRSVDGRAYEPRAALPKLAALREAQAWLRDLSAAEDDAARAALGLPARTVNLAAARRDQGDPAAPAQGAAADRGAVVRRDVAPAADRDADRPYAHPVHWAAFVMIGSPD